MTQSARALVGIVAVIATTLLMAPAAVAQTPDAASMQEGTDNVLITVRVFRLEGGNPVRTKSYSLVVSAGSRGSSLLSGARVPIPTASKGEDAGESMTSYVYQNIGFAITAEARIVDKKKIRLNAEIEDSRLAERGGEGPPTVETRSLKVNTVLTDGQPIEITRVEGQNEDPSGYVEVEAKILR